MQDPFKRPIVEAALIYSKVAEALDFLEKAFGFRRIMVLRDKKGAILHAEMEYGAGGRIIMGPPYADHATTPMNVEGRNTQMVHVLVENADAHCAAAKAAGAEIIREPEDQFYGDRSYVARDPEGHVWTFAQAVRRVTREEAARESGLDIEGWPGE